MISTSLSYYCENVSSHMNVCMIGKSSMKSFKENFWENFYSHLNMEDITDADYTHEIIVSKDFDVKHLGEYHDIYVQSDTLLLGDVLENF